MPPPPFTTPPPPLLFLFLKGGNYLRPVSVWLKLEAPVLKLPQNLLCLPFSMANTLCATSPPPPQVPLFEGIKLHLPPPPPLPLLFYSHHPSPVPSL